MPTTIMSGLIDTVTSGNITGGGGAAMAMMDLMSSGVMPTDAMTGGVRIGDFHGGFQWIGALDRSGRPPHGVPDDVLSGRGGAGAGITRDAEIRRGAIRCELPAETDSDVARERQGRRSRRPDSANMRNPARRSR
jgi:hypothetical protein